MPQTKICSIMIATFCASLFWRKRSGSPNQRKGRKKNCRHKISKQISRSLTKIPRDMEHRVKCLALAVGQL
uniref:Uncharacterized protein n=1 Tax=Anopheles darlingi TaxID=43151 RepID=A0A2M4DIM8_ANODA